MEQEESPFIQTSVGRVSVKEGLVCLEMTEEVITATDIEEHVATLMPLAEQAGVSMPVLIDMGPLRRMDIDARKHIAVALSPQWNRRIAVVYNNPLQRVLASFFLGMDRTAIPFYVTSSREEALQWLLEEGRDEAQGDAVAGGEPADRTVAIYEALSRLAGGDFSIELGPPRRNDELDAIASGISMLAEELAINQEGAQKYQILVDNLNEGIWAIDADAVTTFANEKMAEMLGYTVEEMMGKSLYEFMDDRGKELAEYNFERRRQGIEEQHDFEFITKEGSRLYASLETSPLADSKGNFVGALAGVIDITERRRAEEALRKSEAYYRALMEQTLDCITLLDGNGMIVYESPSITPLLGYSQEELVGRNVFDMIHPEDAHAAVEAFLEGVQASTGNSGQMEVRFKHKDGSWRTFWGVGRNLLDDPDIGGIILNSRDVTDSKTAEQELHASEEHYRLLVANANEVILTTDLDLNVTYASPSAERQTGFTAEEGIGRSVREFITAESFDIVSGMLAEQLTRQRETNSDLPGPVMIEVEQCRKDGSTYPAEISAGFLRNDEGTPYGILVVSRDITEKREAEEALRQSEERYLNVFDNTKNGVAVYEAVHGGEDFVFRDINKAAGIIDEISREDVIGRSVLEVFPGIREFGLFEVFQPVWKTGVPQYHPVSKYADGRITGWRENYVYKLSSGELVAVYEDVTERKRTEDALRESEEHYRLLYDNAGEAIFSYDSELILTDINRLACKAVGYSREELVGKNILELGILHPDDSENVANALRRFLDGEDAEYRIEAEYIFIRKDGAERLFTVTGAAIRDPDGNVQSIINICRDVTEERRIGEALRQSEERYLNVFDNTKNGVAVYEAVRDGEDFIFRDFNKAAEIIADISREDVIGRSVLEVFPGFREFGLFEVLQHVWKTGVPQHHPASLYSDGRITGWRENYVYKLSSGELVAVYEDITDRKQKEEALRKSEEHFRLLFDNAGEAIFSYDSELILTDINRLACKAVGYSREELVGKNILELGILHPDDSENVANALRRFLDGEDAEYRIEAEYIFIRKDGAERLFTVTGAAIRDPDGNVQSIINMCRDITEERRIEEALRQTSDYLESLLDYANAPIIVWDNEFKVRRFNYAFERFTGYAADEVTNGTPNILFPVETREESLGLIERTLSGEHWESVEIPILRKDGDTRIALWNSANIYDKDGKTIIATIAQGQDITESKQAEDALRESEEKYRTLFDNMLEGFVFCRMVYDDDGHPVDWLYLDTNKSFETLTGLENVVGKKVTEVVPGINETNPELFEVYGRVASTGRPEQFEVRLVPLSIDLSIKAFCPMKGYFVAIFENVTKRERTEQEIKHLVSRLIDEGDRVRVNIAADLHDDVGQSLNAIKLALDIQRKKMAGAAADDETRERIASIRDMLSETIEKVRDISIGLVPVNLADFGLDSALENYLGSFSREIGVAFEYNTNGTPTQVGLQVETSLFKIAQEALANVQQHSNASSVAISTSWSESLVSLCVCDDGTGFDVERAYASSRAGDHHFGLVGMRERARMLKGEFSVISEPRKGTSVTVTVPLERG